MNEITDAGISALKAKFDELRGSREALAVHITDATTTLYESLSRMGGSYGLTEAEFEKEIAAAVGWPTATAYTKWAGAVDERDGYA